MRLCGRKSQDEAIHPSERLLGESFYLQLFVSSPYLVLVLLVLLCCVSVLGVPQDACGSLHFSAWKDIQAQPAL